MPSRGIDGKGVDGVRGDFLLKASFPGPPRSRRVREGSRFAPRPSRVSLDPTLSRTTVTDRPGIFLWIFFGTPGSCHTSLLGTPYPSPGQPYGH